MAYVPGLANIIGPFFTALMGLRDAPSATTLLLVSWFAAFELNKGKK